MEQLRTYPTIGVCGLDCGLCPKYYTEGPSRCPGCGGPGFLTKHPSCSFITCVKKKGLEVCGQCSEFPCAKFKTDEWYRQADKKLAYPPCRNIFPNLKFIKEEGIKRFIKLQERRISLLETMIKDYDDGRTKSFFCRAAAMLDPEAVNSALNQVEKAIDAGAVECADKTKVLRALLLKAALREGVELKPPEG